MNLNIINTIYYKIFIVGFCMFMLGRTRQLKRFYNIFACLFVGILIFVSGFRWNTGTDWNSYYSFFNSIFWSNMTSKIFYHFDYGYRLFNVLIKTFTSSYTIFLVILSSVAVCLVYKSLKIIHADVMLGLLIFYANYFLAFYLGSNRMILAMGLTLLGMVSICYGEQRKAFLFGITGFLMHKSSVFYWSTYLVPRKIIKFSRLMFLFLLSLFVGYKEITVKIFNAIINLTISINYMGISLIASTARYYIDEKAEDLGVTHFMLGASKRILVCLFIFFMYKVFAIKKSSKFEYFFNIYVLSICIYFFFYGLGVFQVFSTYLAISEIVVWGTLYKNVKLDKKILLMVVIFILYTIEVLSSFPVYIDEYIPYKTIWG